MKDMQITGFIAFKGDYEIHHAGEVVMELTSSYKDGSVEIAVNCPIPSNPRIYLRFDLGELVKNATARDTNSE